MCGSLGTFTRDVHVVGDDARGEVPVFRQALDAERFAVAFEPGSPTFDVLSNDQKRFTLPRSLPPLLDLELAEDERGSHVVTRYAYTEGAYQLLADLMSGEHVFGIDDFLEFAWSLAETLAFLHEHGIVHGQWNDRSVVAIPVDTQARGFVAAPRFRFEVVNTGVCFRDGASIPSEFVERGYYPPEVFAPDADAPDYGAIDRESDVHGFAAFLRDVAQRAGSAEELGSQAERILKQLQRDANRRGAKASPDELRVKELEILDHLYTIKVRLESIIKDGLRPRGERCSADVMHDRLVALRGAARRYFEQLPARGFQPVNVFGDELQHYTTFSLDVAPRRVNAFARVPVVVSGKGLPSDFVRVTLDERHTGIRVISASPERVAIELEPGFPSGRYAVSINNRRTDADLEVYAPRWSAITPTECHQPWEGFGNLRFVLRGERMTVRGPYALRPLGAEDSRADVAAVVVEASDGVCEPDTAGAREEDALELTFPCDTPPDAYELCVCGIPTGLEVTILEQLAEPTVASGGLHPDVVSNHRSWRLRISGRNLHPEMLVDFGEGTADDLDLLVEGPADASVVVPAGHPPGEHRLRINRAATDVVLRVIAPHWQSARPPSVKFARGQKEPAAVVLDGENLPSLSDGPVYRITGPHHRGKDTLALRAEEIEPGQSHRVLLPADLGRGTHRLLFDDWDTGLTVGVRRSLPRVAALAAAGVVLAGLVFGAFGLRDELTPRIAGFEPRSVFAIGAPEVWVTGKRLAGIELVGSDGAVLHTLAVDDSGDGVPAALRLTGVEPGHYRLRPLGAFLDGELHEEEFRVVAHGLVLEPGTIHRLVDTDLRLRSSNDFPIESLESVELRARDGARSIDLDVRHGTMRVARSTFGANDEGEWLVAVDGEPLGRDSAIRVVGPRVTGVQPLPLTVDPNGRVEMTLLGEHLAADLWFGLAAESDDEMREPIRLVRSENGSWRADVSPGRYRMLVGADVADVEPVPDFTIDVLPAPAIASVTPAKIDPGRETRLTVEGTNLAALEAILLQPLSGDASAVEVPVDAALIEPVDGLVGRYDFGVALDAGAYRVAPGHGVELDVFDDCRQAVEAFRENGDPQALLDCLATGRPPESVIRDAADLLFDRGLLVESRPLYRRLGDDLRARFRASFVAAFGERAPVPMLLLDEEQRRTPWGFAASRLGWAGPVDAEWPDRTTWDLEYAFARSTSDPGERMAALVRSIEKKAQAAGEHELARFEPAFDDLAAARLDFAVGAIRDIDVERAHAVLADELRNDRSAWDRLDAADRATALFWLGHLALWYRGDEAAALDAFERAGALTEHGAGDWSRRYAAALGSDSAPSSRAEGTGGRWEPAFAELFASFREVTTSPNYNLLTERYDGNVYIPAEERRRSVELHRRLRELEALEPADPFAHHALLFHLRNAQRIAWPGQDDEQRAATLRNEFAALPVPSGLAPLRRFYLLLGDLGPFYAQQIAALSRAERKQLAEQAGSVAELPIPEPFREAAAELEKKLLGPSVVWWSDK